MSEENHLSALESLLKELPADEQAALLQAVRKAKIPDDNDVLFHLVHIQGLFAKSHERTAQNIRDTIQSARSNKPVNLAICCIIGGTAFALGAMAGALSSASLSQACTVGGIALASLGIGFVLSKLTDPSR